MAISITLCNNCYYTLNARFIKFRPGIFRFNSSKVLCPSYTDACIENLVLEKGIQHEANLTTYFQNISAQNLLRETLSNMFHRGKNSCDLDLQKHCDTEQLVCCIEKETDTSNIPNEKLKFLLVYFTKDGNVNGVKAIQSIVEKHNIMHFKNQAEYNHYLAEAFWIKGKMNKSLNLFSLAYDNIAVRPKVKVMLPNLFSLLAEHQSDAAISKVIFDIEQFSVRKRDDLILACLWRELFLSTWFSDQEKASKLLIHNNRLLQIVQWMVPAMGKKLLTSHRIDDFFRLIQFTLQKNFKPMTDLLIRLMFDYYYIHQNIERCTAVVKYSSSVNTCLTQEQHRRYVELLLKGKNAVCSKTIVKKPQDLKYTF